ncbi:methionine gamma-lyase family protein, partial [Clostridioides difficile]
LSTKLIKENDIICIEDLQVKNMIRNRKLSRLISDVSWSEFIRKEIREYNQYKVLKAMQESKLSDMHFNWTTGYGYNDIGREKIE